MNDPGCHLLSVPETLQRISGALGPQIVLQDSEASRFLQNAHELGNIDNWTDSSLSLRSVPQWVGEAGAVLSRGSGILLVWLAPRDGSPEAFPSQLVMDRAQNPCFVSTWDTGKCLASGAEVCSGKPLVAGPPFDGFPLIIAVR